jgi:leader peptidase (prepilin peptidase)/N-methyltransferase
MIVDWFAPLAIGVFGLLFGSFANVVIWRLPRKESWSSPPSHCPECDAPIWWRDNIPVVSWLALRGRCRSCGVRISPRYPAVELLSGFLWVLMWFAFGPTLALGFAIVFAYLLLILSFIDLDIMRLPNVLVGLLAAIGLLGVVISQVTGVLAAPVLTGTGGLSQPWAFAGAGLLIGFVLPLVISSLYSLVRGSAGIGMGDVKLLGTIGIDLGPYVLMALMFGSIIGALSAILVRKEGGLRRKIPFGPFLAAGAVATAVVGPAVWAWYSAFL